MRQCAKHVLWALGSPLPPSPTSSVPTPVGMAQGCFLASSFLAGVASGRRSKEERADSGCVLCRAVPGRLQVSVS